MRAERRVGEAGRRCAVPAPHRLARARSTGSGREPLDAGAAQARPAEPAGWPQPAWTSDPTAPRAPPGGTARIGECTARPVVFNLMRLRAPQGRRALALPRRRGRRSTPQRAGDAGPLRRRPWTAPARRLRKGLRRARRRASRWPSRTTLRVFRGGLCRRFPRRGFRGGSRLLLRSDRRNGPA